jgi:hypothetical protein
MKGQRWPRMCCSVVVPWVERPAGEGAPVHKKTPYRSHNIRRGCVSTGAAWPYIHTARLPTRRRIHCRAPLARAAATRIVRPQSPGASHLQLIFRYGRAAAWLSRGQPALAGALAHDSSRVAKRRAGYDSGGDRRRSRPVRVFGRPLTA